MIGIKKNLKKKRISKLMKINKQKHDIMIKAIIRQL